MIAAKTTLMDGDLVDTNNNGAQLTDYSPLVTRYPLTRSYTEDEQFMSHQLAPPILVNPIPSALPFFPSSTVPAETALPAAPTEGTHGSGPAIVEQAARTTTSSSPGAGDGPAQPLPPVTVTGTADGKTSIPWVPILIVLGVTVAIIVAVKVFGKRG